MQKVLLTGFEPFAGEKINPSWEAVKQFENKSIAEIQIVIAQLACVFGEAKQQLYDLITIHQPDLVINVGQAGGRLDVSIERVAINLDDARIPDNKGQQPIDMPIISDAPTAYFSTLPIKTIVKNLNNAGIPASVSQTAGTFVCNHVFYSLMHYIATEFSNMRGGFIHIPYIPIQAAHLKGQASMDLATIIQGLEVIITTALEVKIDIKESGGSIC